MSSGDRRISEPSTVFLEECKNRFQMKFRPIFFSHFFVLKIWNRREGPCCFESLNEKSCAEVAAKWLQFIILTIDDWNPARQPVEVGRLKSHPLKPRGFWYIRVVGLGNFWSINSYFEDFREHTFWLPKAASSMAKFSTDRTIKDGLRINDPWRETPWTTFWNETCVAVFLGDQWLFSQDASQLFSDRKKEPRDFVACFIGQKSNQHSTTANGQPYTPNYFSFLNNGVMHFFSDDFLALKGSEDFLRSPVERWNPNPPGVCGRHLGGETGSEAVGKVARWMSQ